MENSRSQQTNPGEIVSQRTENLIVSLITDFYEFHQKNEFTTDPLLATLLERGIEMARRLGEKKLADISVDDLTRFADYVSALKSYSSPHQFKDNEVCQTNDFTNTVELPKIAV